jgi:hypothetical protein
VLKELFRKAVIETKLFPVYTGTALRNKGVQLILDAVVDYLPSPLDVPQSKVLIQKLAILSNAMPQTLSRFQLWSSNSNLIHSSASSHSSEFILERSKLVLIFTMPQQVIKNAWAELFDFRPISVKKLKKFLLEKLLPLSV